jgi:hypothetical protein
LSEIVNYFESIKWEEYYEIGRTTSLSIGYEYR